MKNDSKQIPEYIGAETFAKMLDTTQQNVSKSGNRALDPNYRGEFLRPDALFEGRPLWVKKKAEEYATRKKELLN
ncbi:hypothetical protein [Paenibacillus apiarius]|uniref:hypothetical protein n=1 Tax=Paenibacillus apiarius TaxID=46240 RepID=UPI003B3B640F